MAHRPRVLFRADASQALGTGHVTRCLAMAETLVGRGWGAALVGRMPEALRETVRAAGVMATGLPDGPGGGAEAVALVAGGALDDVDVVVVDHYGLAADWHRAVRGAGRLVVAIDDLADRPLAVDLVLNQNLGATQERYRELVPAGALILVGPSHALLRPGFAAARDALRERSGTLGRILVFLSGADEHDVTSRAAAAAMAAGVPVDVVVGSAFPSLAGLRGWAASRPGVRVHVDTPEMPALMAGADLAIGAPGSASWERCALALPTLLVVLAENQVENGRALDRAGAATLLGWHHEVSSDRIEAAIAGVAGTPGRLLAMGRAAGAITDGRGATRVADAIEALRVGRAGSSSA